MVSKNASQGGAGSMDDMVTVIDMSEDASLKRKVEFSDVGDENEDPNAKRAKTSNGVAKMTEKQVERQRAKDAREAERLEKERKREEEKQRKLEERQRKEHEKELKRKQAEEEKLERERKREEEKLEKERKREEEKAKKQAEKDERERLRLEKKRKFEEEKQRKEQEKQEELERKRRKEERSQMKISSFFTIKPTSKAKANPDPGSSITTSESAVADLTSLNEAEAVNTKSYYDSKFLPFFVKVTAKMSPSTVLSPVELEKSVNELDGLLFGTTVTSEKSEEDMKKYFQLSETAKSLPFKYTQAHEILGAMNSSDATEAEIQVLIDQLPPIKYLEFYENAKPPYVGTWCSAKHLGTIIPKDDPLNETISGMDYSYDSDLDWNGEDEDEGEDIEDDDDDEDEEDDDEEEMVDFLDDATDSTEDKKRKIMGPLVATCVWGNSVILDSMKCEMLIPAGEFPIDIERNYWNEANTPNTPTKPGTGGGSNVSTPAKPMISEGKDIFNLIQFIEKNSEFSVNVLVELAKKQLDTTYTKAVVKSTIQNIAAYSKKAGKWEIKQDVRQVYYSKYGTNAGAV